MDPHVLIIFSFPISEGIDFLFLLIKKKKNWGGKGYNHRKEIWKRDEGNASLQAGEIRETRRASEWKRTHLPGEVAGGPVVAWGAAGPLSFCTWRHK